MTVPRLVFSLLAHEEPEVLRGQLANIRHHNPDCTVILHLSRAFDAHPDAEGWRARLAALPGVLMNPRPRATRWAHIFHAHLANLRLALEGPDFSHAVLLSSGDLFFRRGLAGALRGHDAAIGRARMRNEQWGDGRFFAGMQADAALNALLPDGPRIHSMHEGTALSRPLLERLLARLEGDWDDDPGYPREEIILPSLVMESGAPSVLLPATLHLRAEEARPGELRGHAAAIIRTLGAAADPLLAAWLDGIPPAPLPEGAFLVSQVPRRLGQPLRRLLAEPGAGPDPAFTRADLVALEHATHYPAALHQRPLSAATRAALLANGADPRLTVRMDAAGSGALPACPGGTTPEFTGPVSWHAGGGAILLSASNLPDALPVTLGPRGAALRIAWSAPPIRPGEARLSLILPLPELVDAGDHLLLELADGTEDGPALGRRAAVEAIVEERASPAAPPRPLPAAPPFCVARGRGRGIWMVPLPSAQPRQGRRMLRLAACATLAGLAVFQLRHERLGPPAP